MKKINSKQYILFFSIIIFAVGAFSVMIYSGARLFFVERPAERESRTAGKECADFRKLDGACLAKGAAEKYPVAVIIDNKFEARPWDGLSFANVVFEAPVEGGITRFLAIYATDKEIKKIGPVRSVRPYFIDWALGYGAIFAHVGGSPEALGIINDNRDIKKFDLDQYYSSQYFWRSSDRFAPHNVYTSSEKLDAAREKMKARDSVFSPWQFKDDDFESERGDMKEIKINFTEEENYDAVWGYDKEKNIYIKKVKGEPVSDVGGSLILAKNIAVVLTDIVIIDALSRRMIVTEGDNTAWIYQDGKKIKGTWEKKDRDSMLYFYDKSGKEIKFNRGTTWIEVVSDLGQVEEE